MQYIMKSIIFTKLGRKQKLNTLLIYWTSNYDQ